MACFFHGDEQSAAPPIRDSHSLGCISLRPPSVLGPLQPRQPVPFLLAHRDSFHPPAHRLSRGTFYFAQLGTYHFAATRTKRNGSLIPSVCYARPDMQGRVVVITGATSGIGQVAAEKLGRMGARLVLLARDRDRGEAALARMRDAGP